jgi:uncharacterized protein (DUF433 family)
MSQSDSRITVSPEICHGKPCLRGLRYPVETIRELMESGMTDAEILADYADLDADDLNAVRESWQTIHRGA